jgi:DNA-directed RNA polymerase sigma subunit (sigma70/sigma32)
VEFSDRSERLKQLIHIGKTKGYILYDEIDDFLPTTLEADAHLDVVLTELVKSGIDILEEPRARYELDVTEDGKVSSEKALQKVVEELDLVVAIARRRSGPRYDLLELLQEGNIGLMKARRSTSTRESIGFQLTHLVDPTVLLPGEAGRRK